MMMERKEGVYVLSGMSTSFVRVHTLPQPCAHAETGYGKLLSLETLRPRNMSDNSWALTIFADQQSAA